MSLSCQVQPLKNRISTLDIAKRLIDFNYHPPTVYFPLIVKEAIMIEPTESADKDTLDGFAEVLIEIAREAQENPDLVKIAHIIRRLGVLMK